MRSTGRAPVPTAVAAEAAEHQKRVNAHFKRVSSYWAEVYQRDDDVDAVIFQERLDLVLRLVKGIGLPPDAPVLEIGCGAGHATLALAKLGYIVDAIDTVGAMAQATRSRAAEAGLAARVRSGIGDIRALSFECETFSLVLAIGVLPWLTSIEEPLREISRVLKPGGHAIVSVDNRWGLRQFLEPFTNPILRTARQMVRRGKAGPLNRTTAIRGCDASLRRAGLEKREGVTLGFGPFTCFGHELLPAASGLKVHRILQGLADRNVPGIRSGGYQYVVLTRKRQRNSGANG
jgi:SAM-dependent methyltransferase